MGSHGKHNDALDCRTLWHHCWRASCQRSSVASRSPRSCRRSACSSQRQIRSGGHSWSPSSHHSPTDSTTNVRRSNSTGVGGGMDAPRRCFLGRGVGLRRFGRLDIGGDPCCEPLDRPPEATHTVRASIRPRLAGCRQTTVAIVISAGRCGYRRLWIRAEIVRLSYARSWRKQPWISPLGTSS